MYLNRKLVFMTRYLLPLDDNVNQRLSPTRQVISLLIDDKNEVLVLDTYSACTKFAGSRDYSEMSFIAASSFLHADVEKQNGYLFAQAVCAALREFQAVGS